MKNANQELRSGLRANPAARPEIRSGYSFSSYFSSFFSAFQRKAGVDFGLREGLAGNPRHKIRMKYRLIALSVGLCLILTACDDSSKSANESPLISYVNPFIGTGGHGHTYPGPTLPFGMVQLSPDTRLEGWDGCSGYHDTDSVVFGFSHTHLSGTGVGDYGDILLMPTSGPIRFNNGADGQPGYASSFLKSKEKAEAGYYATYLEDYQIGVELTATERVGFHQYRFESDADTANLILDLLHRDKVLNSGLRIISNTEIEGFRISEAWAKEQHVYFVAKFSEPFIQFSSEKKPEVNPRNGLWQSQDIKAAFQFKAGKKPLLVKVGLSFVDIAGARNNLQQELPGWDFGQVKEAAQAAWEQQLSKIRIADKNKENKTVFYSALYHASIVPNLFMDLDGRYRGTDLKIHQASDHTRYSVFSLWDTYRAAKPLYSIIEPERMSDFVKTLLGQHEEGGKLCMWELAGNYTGCMIGYHSVPVIVDAWMKGYRDFDAKKALQAMVEIATADELGKPIYEKAGFLPAESEHESVSKTLEYAYDDWCIAIFAQALGEEEIYRRFMQRAQFYKNVLDPETHFMRSKVGHRWEKPFDPTEVTFAFTEANSWQYSFFAPHDMAGLAALYGGNEALEKRLDELFVTTSEVTGRDMKDISGLIGQYAHGNEPSHHIAYLYNYLGKPWKSQKLLRQILDEMYFNAPDGLSGNEDCGQMSAWYILSSMGFYPVVPGSNEYVIGSPLFDEAVIEVGNGKSFTITSENNGPKAMYVQEVRLNGEPLSRNYITHDQIMAGGSLHFVMGDKPHPRRGIAPEDAPTSKITDFAILPVPAIAQGRRAFYGQDTLVLNHLMKDAQLYYTLDGSEPVLPHEEGKKRKTQLYEKAFTIDESCTLTAVAYHPDLGKSKIIQTDFFKVPGNRSIRLETEYASYYAAGGDEALIDFLKGGNDFRTGDWQGYHGVDILATVDLSKKEKVNKVSITFLQDNKSWIFMPLKVRLLVSDDGKNFVKKGELSPQSDERLEGSILEDFDFSVNERVRYIRIEAVNRGVCPSWHLGAGGEAWIFADEIRVE